MCNHEAQSFVFPVWDLKKMRIFRLRFFTQVASTFLQNSSFQFFTTKGPYTGFLKSFCSFGLNCYSCPMAWFSCPLGIIQNLFTSLRILPAKVLIPAFAYSLGLILLMSLVLGRFICGWLCPFGLLQELLYRIPFYKKEIALPYGLQRYLKHLFLAFFVILLPILYLTEIGYGLLWFCKFVCPAGTLEAGYLNLILQPHFTKNIGIIFYLKTAFLFAFFILCIVDLRFFCKNICPLGLIYGIFNKYGLFRLRWNENKCTLCGVCEKICPMSLHIPKDLNSVECIRCLNCLSICPSKAISLERSLLYHPNVDLKSLTIKELKYGKK